MTYLVIDVGGTFVKYALMNEQCEFIEKGKIPTIPEPLDAFIDSLTTIYRTYSDQVAGIALSMPGLIDGSKGFMYTGGFISCISNLNIIETLQQQCPVPITVGNDAKCAALAELWQGSLQNCNNAITLVVGTGVGGAIIQNGRVLNGSHFMAGEFSYVLAGRTSQPSINQAFGLCSGIPGLIRYASKKMHRPESELDGMTIFQAANCGHQNAIEAIRSYSADLALQISNFRFILDPEKIAIGGGISAQPLFLQLIKEELKKVNDIYEPWGITIPEVVNCKFFNDSNLIGALYLHLKASEPQFSSIQIEKLWELVKERREGQYLMDLLSD